VSKTISINANVTGFLAIGSCCINHPFGFAVSCQQGSDKAMMENR